MKPPPASLPPALEARVRWLETTLQPSTVHHYRHTVRLFLRYLNENYPEVSKPSQLRRDPHVLGWLEYLWRLRTSRGRPLTSSTRGQHLLRLRTLFDLLADLPQPPMPGLLRSQDIPPRQYRLPRPLTPEDDARLQQHWAGATDVLSGALLLQRLTGMRIGECVDLAPDCLRHLGDNRWSLHVPHGKPRSERWVPVDDQVLVGVGQGPGHLPDQPGHRLHRHRALGTDPLPKRHPSDMGHHEADYGPLLLDRVNWNDMRVTEPRGGPCLLQEARTQFGVCRELRGQQLDGDGPVERDVPRPIDDPHPPSPDLLLEQVPPRQRGGQGQELRTR